MRGDALLGYKNDNRTTHINSQVGAASQRNSRLNSRTLPFASNSDDDAAADATDATDATDDASINYQMH